MSEIRTDLKKVLAIVVQSLMVTIFMFTNVQAGIDGTDLLGIDGTDAMGIDGTDLLGIDGTDAMGIDGTDLLGIDGTDAMGIDGTDLLGIDGTDAMGIDGTDLLGIDGTDAMGIDGTDLLGIDGTDLLAIGMASLIDSNIISVLGQTIAVSPGFAGRDFAGKTVAVYGQIDFDTGSFTDTRLVALDASSPSFIRGMVDSVNAKSGIAVVNGFAVDYTALLANGVVPKIGDEVSVFGYAYSGLGLLVADPSLTLDLRR